MGALDQQLSDIVTRVRGIEALLRVGRAARRPAPREVLTALKSALAVLAAHEEVSAALTSACRELETAIAREALELESAVRDECGKKGWRIDGQWPQLFVERGIELRIDEKDGSARIEGARLASADPKGIVHELDKRVRTLLPRSFSSTEFLRALVRAHGEVTGGAQATASLRDAFRAMVVAQQADGFWNDARREKFRELSTAQFRARLAHAVAESGSILPDGRRVVLLPPLDPREGLFMYQPAEQRFAYVGRIEVR